MRSADAMRIKLRTQLRHSIFVPDRIDWNPKMERQAVVEIPFTDLPAAAFEPARLHGQAAQRRFEVVGRYFFEQTQECQSRAKQYDRFFPVDDLRPQSLELETAILGDEKSIRLEVCKNSAHPAQRGKRGVIRVLHQKEHPGSRETKIVPTSLNGRLV